MKKTKPPPLMPALLLLPLLPTMQLRRKIFPAFFLLALLILLPAANVFAQEMEDFPVARLRSLDKVTARTMTFEADVGSTLKFGSVYIKVQACRKAPPLEKPESAAFLQIWEVTPEDEAQWVFSGWMFASSPGLSSMDHPIYDVWVLDCLQKKGAKDAEAKKEEAERGEGEVSEEQITEKPDTALEEKPAEEQIPEEDIPQEDVPSDQ